MDFKEKMKIAKSKMNVDIREHTFNIFFSESRSFSDKKHYYNHINYLFRTDKNKQWTNDETIGNSFVDDFQCNYFGECCMKDVSDKYKQLYNDKKILLHSLRMTQIYFDDVSRNYRDNNFLEGLRYSFKKEKSRNNIIPLLIVVHKDQEEIHGHYIYMITGNSDMK